MRKSTSPQPLVGDRRSGALVLLAFVAMVLLASCGGNSTSEKVVDRPPIRVQGESVTGERLVYRDLGDTDTMLWFWAPW